MNDKVIEKTNSEREMDKNQSNKKRKITKRK